MMAEQIIRNHLKSLSIDKSTSFQNIRTNKSYQEPNKRAKTKEMGKAAAQITRNHLKSSFIDKSTSFRNIRTNKSHFIFIICCLN